MLIDDIFICLICGKEFTHYISFYAHLKKKHSEISKQEYYNTYIEYSSNHICLCGKPLKFRSITLGYRKTCGNIDCINKVMSESIKSTFIKNYDVENIFEAEWCKEKIKEKHLENLGVEYPTQSEEVIETRRQNNLEKYDVINVFNADFAIKKSKETCLRKYGNEYYRGQNSFGGFGFKSQKLFFILDKKLQKNNIKVDELWYGYFKNKKKIKKEKTINVREVSKKWKVRFLDCYIKRGDREINFEFDEDWHSKSFDEDLIREQEILTIKPNLEIYRIKEKDYDENFYQIIEDLIEIIKNKDTKTFYEYKNLMEK